MSEPFESDPALRMTFNGLFFFCFRNDGHCDVGVHTQTARPHDVHVMIEELPATPCTTSRFTLEHPVARGLRRVQLKAGTPQPISPHPPVVVPDRSNPSLYPRAFGWVIDFQHSFLHGSSNLDVKRGIFKPLLVLETGTFYSRVNSANDYVVRQRGVTRYFGYVADLVEVEISDAARPLQFDITGPTGTNSVLVPPDKKYRIAVENIDRELAPREGANLNKVFEGKSGPKVPPSDIGEYYKAFQAISENDRCRFDPIANADDGRGLPPSICYATTASSTTTIPE